MTLGYRIFKSGGAWGGEVEEMMFDAQGRHVTWTAQQLSDFFNYRATPGWSYRVESVR